MGARSRKGRRVERRWRRRRLAEKEERGDVRGEGEMREEGGEEENCHHASYPRKQVRCGKLVRTKRTGKVG